MGKQPHYAGAGGDWTVHNESPDPAVIQQAGADYCRAACIEMLLAAKGINANQEEIAARIGAPTSITHLAPELQRGDPARTWQTAVFRDFPTALLYLNKRYPWIACMKDFGTRVLHAVTVDGVDQAGDLLIRDPYPPGTSYAMTLADFSDPRHGWTGIATYAKRSYIRRQIKRKPRDKSI